MRRIAFTFFTFLLAFSFSSFTSADTIAAWNALSGTTQVDLADARVGTAGTSVGDVNNFISGSGSETNSAPDETMPFSLDLGTEAWASYTPATASSSSLQLAPTSGFTATPGLIDAYGFFLQDVTTDTTSDGRWRIAGFEVTSVPEPNSLAVLGLVSIVFISRRRRLIRRQHSSGSRLHTRK